MIPSEHRPRTCKDRSGLDAQISLPRQTMPPLSAAALTLRQRDCFFQAQLLQYDILLSVGPITLRPSDGCQLCDGLDSSAGCRSQRRGGHRAQQAHQGGAEPSGSETSRCRESSNCLPMAQRLLHASKIRLNRQFHMLTWRLLKVSGCFCLRLHLDWG